MLRYHAKIHTAQAHLFSPVILGLNVNGFSIASPCFYTRLDMVCGCFTSLFLRVIHAMSTDGMFSHSSLGSCSPSSKDYFIHAQKSLEDFTAKNTRPSGFRRARHPFSNTTAGQNFSLTNNLTSWFL
jgi:hypothetical protein